jgi:hypothetical protein
MVEPKKPESELVDEDLDGVSGGVATFQIGPPKVGLPPDPCEPGAVSPGPCTPVLCPPGPPTKVG